jgi:HPt (histidine-containing phosphotransfer) domain-containing protein
MDDYLSKPIDRAHLQAILDRWLPRPSAPPARTEAGAAAAKAAPKPADPPPESPPVDEERLRLVSDGNPQGLARLIATYLRSTQDDMQHLRQALKDGSAKEVHRVAHGCAGASETFGMTAIVTPLRELMNLTKQGRLTKSATLLLDQAQREFDRIKSYWKARQDPPKTA